MLATREIVPGAEYRRERTFPIRHRERPTSHHHNRDSILVLDGVVILSVSLDIKLWQQRFALERRTGIPLTSS